MKLADKLGDPYHIDVWVDDQTGHDACDILDALGIPMDVAINMYLRQIVLRGGLPFELRQSPGKAGKTGGKKRQRRFLIEEMDNDDLVAEAQAGIDSISDGGLWSEEALRDRLKREHETDEYVAMVIVPIVCRDNFRFSAAAAEDMMSIFRLLGEEPGGLDAAWELFGGLCKVLGYLERMTGPAAVAGRKARAMGLMQFATGDCTALYTRDSQQDEITVLRVFLGRRPGLPVCRIAHPRLPPYCT